MEDISIRNASHVGRLQVLTERDLSRLHDGALAILETVGMRTTHDRAVRTMTEAGCTVVEGRVLTPRRLVEEARRTVPPRVTMYDRAGRLAMELGGYNSYFGTGSDLRDTWDLETKELRRSTLEDTARAARLADALPNIDFVMSGAYANELEPKFAPLREFQAMVLNTTKPLVVVAASIDDTAVMYEISCVLRGGDEPLAAKPYMIVYSESVSPLQHFTEALDKLIFSAERRLPVLYTPATLAGGTAPMTVAGQLAQGLAEYYFGMVLHQLVSPGAPLLFGIGPLVLDMSTMQASYSAVEMDVGHLAMVEIARWLDHPNWGYAGCTDSHCCLDAQAGIEIATMILLTMQAGSNLNHDVGYQGFGLASSLEQIVVCDEYVSMARRLLQGVEVSDDDLALDVIAEVGPGGDFISHKHTRRHCRSGQWRPLLFNRASRVSWEEAGSLDLREKARRRALEILDAHTPPNLPADLIETIECLIADFEATEPNSASLVRPMASSGPTCS